MKFIIFILSIYVFIKTIAYSVFEYKENRNNLGGLAVLVMGVLALLFPNVVYFYNLFF